MELSLKYECEALSYRFEQQNLVGKMTIKNKILAIAFSDATSMCPPLDKVKANGRTKSVAQGSTKYDSACFEIVDDYINSVHNYNSIIPSTDVPFTALKRTMVPSTKVIPYINQFPSELHCYIDDIIDVVSDGNCGFRAVAALLGNEEHNWAQIRIDLVKELQEFHHEYVALYGSVEKVNQLLDSLYTVSGMLVTPDKWMSIPNMGYLIATKFKLVFLVLSNCGCMTFFPLRGHSPHPCNHKIIVTGLVNSCHFVQVHLKDGHPMPPIAYKWRTYCHADARNWESPYLKRIQQFKLQVEKN